MNFRTMVALAGLLAAVACDDGLDCTDQSCTPLVVEIELQASTLTAPSLDVVADGEVFAVSCPAQLPEVDVYAPCTTSGGEGGEDYNLRVELLGAGETIEVVIHASTRGGSHTIGPDKLEVSIDGGEGEVFAETFAPEYEDQGEIWGPGCGTCSTASIQRPLAE